MRTEKEIRERLEKLKKERLTQGPYIEKDDVALHATKQTLEWVLKKRKPTNLLIKGLRAPIPVLASYT